MQAASLASCPKKKIEKEGLNAEVSLPTAQWSETWDSTELLTYMVDASDDA